MRSRLAVRKWRLPLLFLLTLSVAAMHPLSARAQPTPAHDSKAESVSPSADAGPAETRAPTAKVVTRHDTARDAAGDPGAPRTALASGGTPTLGLMTGELNGTFVQIGSDISSVVSSPSLRVIPLLGKGSLQNLGDLLNLRGVDLALVAADAARFAEARNLYPGLRGRVDYIAKLYDQEIHVLAGPDVHSLADLAGKTVNVDVEGSGTSITAATLFDSAHIPVKMTNDTPEVGLRRLMNGEIAAIVYVIGKPGRLFTAIPANTGLHLIPVPVSEPLLQTYLPATFRHADYPALIAEGDTVETMAVPVLLTAVNWAANSPRYKNLATFTDLLFSHLPELQQPPHHPKWRDVNPAANVPGWTRAPYAQQWLDRSNNASTTGPRTPDEEQAFKRWAASIGLVKLTATQRAQLFSLWQLRRDQPQH